MRTHRLRFLGHTAMRPDYRMTKQLLFTKYVPGARSCTVRQIHNVVEVLREDLEGFEQYTKIGTYMRKTVATGVLR